MNVRARDHVLALSAALSVVALALVFGAATQVLPSGWLPRTSDAALEAIPHVNALVSLMAITTIAAGWLAIRRNRIRRHRRLMLVSLGLFATFLLLYLYRVALLGPAPFPGPEEVYLTVYLPLLGVHILLAVVCIPLLWYVVLIGLTHPVADVYGTRHRTVGRIAAPLWVTSFALGFCVYLLLHWLY